MLGRVRLKQLPGNPLINCHDLTLRSLDALWTPLGPVFFFI